MPRLAIALSPGFADWEYALLAGTGGPFYGLDVAFFGVGDAPFRSQGGLLVTPDRTLEALAGWGADALAVIGGTLWESAEAPDLSEMLIAFHEAGGVVGGICGGTLALARAGLLDDRRHTSNAPDFLTSHGGSYRGRDHYVDTATAVAADRVITAPGTAPVSFTARIFGAVGVPADAVAQFQDMLAAEHRGT